MSDRAYCEMASHYITGATATATCLAICSHVAANCADDDTKNDGLKNWQHRSWQNSLQKHGDDSEYN